MSKENFKKYFIASDMDGTFLGEKASLVKNNLDAIKYFNSNGGKFTISTGRSRKELEALFPEFEEYINCPAIVANGSYIYDYQTKRYINEKVIDFDIGKEVFLKVKEDFKDIALRISFEDGIVCPITTEYLNNCFGAIRKLVVSDDFDYLKDHRIHKMVFIGEEERIRNLRNYLPKTFPNVNFTFSSNDIVEVIPDNTSKGKILSNLKYIIGENRKSICVGDYLNDKEMLLNSDISASPSNACAEIKEITKIHLCSNIEGCIADLIYKLENEKF